MSYCQTGIEHSRPTHLFPMPAVEKSQVVTLADDPQAEMKVRLQSEAAFNARHPIAIVSNPQEAIEGTLRILKSHETRFVTKLRKTDEHLVEFVPDKLFEETWYYRLTSWSVFLLTIVGIFTVSNAIAQPLIAAGIYPDMMRSPWKAYSFASLPIVSMTVPLAFSMLVLRTDKARSYFALALSAITAFCFFIFVYAYSEGLIASGSTSVSVENLAERIISGGNSAAGSHTTSRVLAILFIALVLGETAFGGLAALALHYLRNRFRVARPLVNPEFEALQARISAIQREIIDLQHNIGRAKDWAEMRRNACEEYVFGAFRVLHLCQSELAARRAEITFQVLSH